MALESLIVQMELKKFYVIFKKKTHQIILKNFTNVLTKIILIIK